MWIVTRESWSAIVCPDVREVAFARVHLTRWLLDELEAGHVREVLRIERPQRRTVDDGARRDRQIDFAMVGPLQAPVEVRRHDRFTFAERGCARTGKERFLVVELLRRPGTTPPFVEHDRRKSQTDPIAYEAPEDGRRHALTRKAGDQR